MFTERLTMPFAVMVIAAGIFLFGSSVLQAADVEEGKSPVAESESVKSAVTAESGKMPEEQKKPDMEEALKEIREGIKVLQRGQAGAGADMTAVGDQIRKLRGDIEDIGKTFGDLRQERKEIDAKLTDILSRIKAIEIFLGLRDGKASEGPKRWEEKPAPNPEGAKGAKSTKSALYEEAFGDFREGRYGEARGKFQKFLEQKPDLTLATDAQFWIGECYYLENDYEKAILEYEKVIKNYPRNDKAPHALLMQGFSFNKLGDAASAKLFFKELVDEFPESLQAKVAKQQLEPPKDQQ